MADLPSASADTALGAVFTGTQYLSLHTADPGTTGANEVSGGSYARQSITWNTASGGSITSSNAQSFTSMPAESGNLWIGIWSASTGGTFVIGDPNYAVTGPIASGGTVSFPAGSVTVAAS